jgi:hypothetical protein
MGLFKYITFAIRKTRELASNEESQQRGSRSKDKDFLLEEERIKPRRNLSLSNL